MKWKIVNNMAQVDRENEVLSDTQSVLDFLMTVHYETGCNMVIVDKEIFTEDFYDLKTGLAGEILQKFINYQMRLAIVGDFDQYSSKSFRDFRIECNRGRHIYFASDLEEALRQGNPN